MLTKSQQVIEGFIDSCKNRELALDFLILMAGSNSIMSDEAKDYCLKRAKEIRKELLTGGVPND